MRIGLKTLCALAATALLTCACDDGDDADSTAFSSGLEPSKTVAALTDDEAQQFCDATARGFGNLVSARKVCELTSVFFTEDAATCRAFTDQCLQAPPEPDAQPEGEPQEEACAIADAANRMGCEETVEALEGCLGSLRGLTVSTLAQIGCGDAGNVEGLEAKLADLPSDVSEVPGCESVAANCPQLFADDEPMNSVMPPMDSTADQ